MQLIQANLFKFLNRVERPDWVKSGRKGESYITNAEAHVNSLYGMKSDISDFYGSVTYRRIRHTFFNGFRMSPDIAEILTILVTHYRRIPTGAAASMLMAYFAYEEMFQKIHEISEKNDIVFTLYVDDLSFSANTPIGMDFFYQVRDIVQSYGFVLKWKKTKFYGFRKYKEFTGVGISAEGRLVVPNRHRKEIIDGYRESLSDCYDENKIQSLRGKVNAARQIEPQIFPQIYDYVQDAG